MRGKPTICLDFDGVVHAYSKGWQDGSIYDGMVPGFLEWAAEAQKHFILCIYSSRSSSDEGRLAMGKWLADQLRKWKGEPIEFTMSAEKPPAWVTIDDRAVRFDGNWDDPDLRPIMLLNYKPWMNR
jgi:hypothetical protein